jgi:hypothetical protein
MPRKQYPPHPVRDAFLARLRAFYADCGSPKPKEIVQMAQRLQEIYSDDHGLRSLSTTFSTTGISETLNGYRKTLPDPVWVACFILCCQRLAYEAGTYTHDPGRSSLPAWQSMLKDAENDAKRLGLPLRRGLRASTQNPSDTRTPTGQTKPASTPRAASSSRRPDHTSNATGPIRLSNEQKEHLTQYGEYGRALHERSLNRDPHAVYQIALLLAADPTRGYDATPLLTDAAATGHPKALALLQQSPQNLDRRLATVDALELARQANEAGNIGAAVAFYECFARFTAGSTIPDATPAAATAVDDPHES